MKFQGHQQQSKGSKTWNLRLTIILFKVQEAEQGQTAVGDKSYDTLWYIVIFNKVPVPYNIDVDRDP